VINRHLARGGNLQSLPDLVYLNLASSHVCSCFDSLEFCHVTLVRSSTSPTSEAREKRVTERDSSDSGSECIGDSEHNRLYDVDWGYEWEKGRANVFCGRLGNHTNVTASKYRHKLSI